MHSYRPAALVPALVLTLFAGGPAAAQEPYPIELIVQAGRPLRVALDDRIRVRRVGQPVTGTLVDAVHAYDRVVLPAGTKVIGKVETLEGPSTGTRLRALLNLDLSPPRRVGLRFDALVSPGGATIPIETEVRSATERIALQTRSAPRKKGVAARAGQEVADRARQTIAAVEKPGRGQRLKQTVVGALPFHPQYLRAGTVYTAVLQSPLSFGTAGGTEAAAASTAPAPESILRARLLTALDSAKTPKGTPVQAAVIEPVFSADHRLILPEGTILGGEVTFARPARRFHRNGQLRFLFETVQVPEQAQESMRASLYSVQVGQGQRVSLDDEGGATITNTRTRFVAPALGALALAATVHGRLDYDTDGLGPEMQYGSFESRAAGGFLGFGLLGAGLSQLSRPVAVGLGAIGLVRSVIVSVAGKGRNVSFPADTVIEVQLGPEPTPAR